MYVKRKEARGISPLVRVLNPKRNPKHIKSAENQKVYTVPDEFELLH